MTTLQSNQEAMKPEEKEFVDLEIPIWAHTCRIYFHTDQSLKRFNDTKQVIVQVVIGFVIGLVAGFLITAKWH